MTAALGRSGGHLVASGRRPSTSPSHSPEPQVDLVQQLKDLAELKDQGILTEEESSAQKTRILSG